MDKLLVFNSDKMKSVLFGMFFINAVLLPFAALQAKTPHLTAEELSAAPPKVIRFCCSFGADLGIAGVPFAKKTDITSLEKIGPHSYLGNDTEGNGNIYTRRGGFLDLGHLRDYADWTAWLYCRINESLQNNASDTIDLGNEGGSKTLILTLPTDATNINVYKLAGKIAYDLSLWHEIATWFGASYVPLLPERYSSFSPEDLYSNLMGITIGMRALKSEMEYNDAVTVLLSNMLDSLEVVSTEAETYEAMENVNYYWWTDQKKLPSKKILLKHYFDSEHSLEPWLVPDILHQRTPWILFKPKTQIANLYELNIKLNYRFPKKMIFPDLENREITQKDFARLIEVIEEELNKTTSAEPATTKSRQKRKRKNST